MRLIDIEAVLKAAELAGKEYVSIDFLKGFEQVDAVPVVRGKWIPNQHWEYRNGNTTMSGDTGLGCSACGAVNFTGINQRTPFCPHCGARMDGEP